MAKEPPVVAVLGYGCFLTDEVIGLLNAACDFIQTQKVEFVILTGGQTNPRSAPDVSEAGLTPLSGKPSRGPRDASTVHPR